MSTKFFTNESENTLLNKIEGIFQYRNIHFFDALVGYFYASGYFRIRTFIEKAKEIRILVGIEVDKLVYEAHKEGLKFGPDKERTEEEFLKDIKKNIQEAAYNKDVEDGMVQLIQDLVSGKIKIKVHPTKKIHAKLYIFREKVKHDHGYGAVITGSSNLSAAGLEGNFEFNVELRDNDDIEFSTLKFDELWNEGVEINIERVAQLRTETYLNDLFTPFEIYYKFLIEYFGKSIEFDPDSVTDLPKGFLRLSYQIDAVSDGYNKLKKHNGFFLSDVVGLGKTIVATLIAKKFFYQNNFPSYISRTLIITPPAIEENWRTTIEKFGLHNTDIITNGSLHKVKNAEKYDLIIVDEAHKFRNDAPDMYNDLQIICKSPTRQVLPNGDREKKKVMLISATPLNNRPEDIANLVYLFQDSKDSTLEIGNLQHFFRGIIDQYKKLHAEKDIKKVQAMVKILYERVRNKIIEPLTVRRTRTDLKEHEMYSADLVQQGIIFPEPQVPRKIFYQLDKQLDDLYDHTIYCLSHETEGFTYFRYQAIKYLLPHKKSKYRNADRIAANLANIMKTMLVKRIDSSFYAFNESLKRFLYANTAMVKMFENGKIYIASELKVSEYIMEDKEEELLDMIINMQEYDPTIEICSPDDFQTGFLDGLKKDQKILQDLVDQWGKIVEQDIDPKRDEFIRRLKNELLKESINKNGKLVVFSESKDTTNYLKAQLDKAGFKKTLSIDSTNRSLLKDIVKFNFDENIPEIQKSSEYNILISTEVLAEGINLHRANVIVNYDTPWNSTRLMQRMGRVNRIGSRAEKIFIYNFFPTAKVEIDIELEKKAIMKLQAFHAALGEDSQIYTPDEETNSFGLFDKNIEEERDERLVYLMKLRKFREENPELFKRIRNMPLRARVGRKNKVFRDGTICFIRNQKRDSFNYVKADNELDELTFVETAKVFHAEAEEKPLPLHDQHHEQVKKAVELFAKQIRDENTRQKTIDGKKGPNERKALEYLDAILHLHFVSEEEKQLLRLGKDAISRGKFQNLQRDINKLSRAVKKTPLKPTAIAEKVIEILRRYPLYDKVDTEQLSIAWDQVMFKEEQPEIIISESFI